MKTLNGTKLVSYDLVEEVIQPFIPEEISEKSKRPPNLRGTTYKIKPSNGDGTAYVTINDIILNAGTEHEEIRPFEIFVNSKNVDHFQWVSALTRVISAVFRKGGDYRFLADELKEVFDPRGGYWEGPKYIDSIVAHIGQIIEQHINGMEATEVVVAETPVVSEGSGFPENSVLCKSCRVKAVVTQDGCPVCLNCGDSKCG